MKTFLFSVLLAVQLLLPVSGAEQRVPILMYHDFSDNAAVTGDLVVSADRFDEHLSALEKAGYHTVSFGELIDYVYYGAELPENPIVITADDGYSNVLDCAAGCAARHGMKLSCAVLGFFSGKPGHISLTSPVPDNVEIVSHTYFLHDREGWDGAVCTVLAPSVYEEILTSDCEAMRFLCGEMFPEAASVLVYPHGKYSAESERTFHSLGYAVTVTCDRGIAEIRRGEPESLYCLPRISVWRNTTAEKLLEMIANG